MKRKEKYTDKGERPIRKEIKREIKNGKVIYHIPKPERYIDEKCRQVHSEYYAIGSFNDLDEKRLLEISILRALQMLKNPDRFKDPEKVHLSDNNPLLKEKMQTIYDENFKTLKLRFTGAETSFLEPEYINILKNGLTEYINKPSCSLGDRIEAKRLLMFYKEKEIAIKKIENLISPKKESKKWTYEGLWRDSDNAKEVKRILEFKGYTNKGEWVGLTKNKNELLILYDVLSPLLKPHKKAPVLKLIYKEFKFSDTFSRSTIYSKISTENESRKEFENIFFKLL